MLDKWKEKLRNFIWKEEEVEGEESLPDGKDYEQPNNIHHIEARMVYQYPNERKFQFPVIPDEKHVKQSTDIPAYKRRKPEREKSEYKTEQQVEPKKHIPDPPVKQKTYKKDGHTPFKPSRVASPIYGYQERRKAREVEETPAFMRKRDSNDTVTPKVAEDRLAAKKHKEENQKINREEEKQNSELQPVQPNKSEERKLVKERNHAAGNELDTKKMENIIEPNDEKNGQLKKNEQKIAEKEKKRAGSKKPVPFNVMMTPRDKKNLLEKKRAEREKKQLVSENESQSTSEPLFSRPPVHLLNEPAVKSGTNDLWIEEQKDLLEQTLKHFNVRATVVNATQGPSVTRFEVKPELGVKVSRIRNLSDDLKLNMAAKDIRIEAPIPGKNTVGIEVPNLEATMVGLQEIFDTESFKQDTSPLTVALGLDIEGSPIITDIQKMPHGLIAGATGSGKSVCINTVLISLLYKASHEDVKLLLIDPKMVELAQYNGIPHLVSPVITDVKAATAALKWAVNEMEERYEKFVKEGVRNIEGYNEKVKERGADDHMPFIVIVIDELADLMMISPQDVEDSISRIAQKARACGIHLLLATQRPSVDVITGLIKANIPTRIAFSVSSQVDSRTIIDVGGAEKLLGKGDMLFVENGAGQTIRLQGAFVSDEEISRVTNHARKIASPNYLFEQETLLEEMTMMEDEDELTQDAIDFVLEQNSASTSMLQRHFKIGYNRAARLIDSLEQRGIISGQNGSKPRDVLVTKYQLEEMNL